MFKCLKPFLPILFLTVAAFAGVKFLYFHLEQKFSFVHNLPEPPKPAEQPAPAADPSQPNPPPESATPQADNKTHEQEIRQLVERARNVQQFEQSLANLKLLGTIIGKGRAARAVIADLRSKSERIYRVGDQVGEAKVKKISWDRVVLSYNGIDGLLEMKGTQAGTRPATGDMAGIGSASSLPAGSKEIVMDQPKLDRILANINKAQGQVALQPHFENGKPSGVKLGGAQVDAALNEAGIQNGDIVKSVNGQAIKSVNDAMRVYEGLKASGATYAVVEILRNGQTIILYYQVP